MYVSMYWYGLASFQKFLLWFSVAECAGAVSSKQRFWRTRDHVLALLATDTQLLLWPITLFLCT